MSLTFNNYLETALCGNFQIYSENRLTKVFCSSFNESEILRRIFLNFIDCDTIKSINIIARDQKYYPTKRRNLIDIEICSVDKHLLKPKIIIENKIESKLTKDQLKNYNSIKEIRTVKYKIALVKKYFETKYKNWQIYYWAELYYYIVLSKVYQKLINNSKDKFIIDNFLNVLKINNMTIIPFIEKEAINSLSNIFDYKKSHTLRKYNPFEIACNYITILEGLVNKVKESTILMKRIGRNYQFNSYLHGFWVGDTKYPAIYAEIRFKKPYRNKKGLHIGKISTGVYFDKKNPDIRTVIQDKAGNFLDEKHFNKGNLNYLKYSEQTIEFWENHLK